MLRRAEKEQLVKDLAEKLSAAPAAVVLSFRALTMTNSARLRRALRPTGGRLQVVPKRLFRRVAEQLGWPPSLGEGAGSVAVAWTEGPAKPSPSGRAGRSGGADILAPAKSVHAYAKAAEGASILGGVFEGSLLDGASVERLAVLPPAETLRGTVVSVLAAPIRGLVGVLSGVLRGLPVLFEAAARIKSGGEREGTTEGL